jgi:hypothetical protein
VASTPIPKDRRSARIATVEQHIRLENEHDLEGVLRTFGDNARYDDEPWGEHYEGRNGVRLFYEQLMKALPDLEIEVKRRHVTDSRYASRWVAWPSGDRANQLSSRFAVCTRSMPMTVWRGKESIMTGARC